MRSLLILCGLLASVLLAPAIAAAAETVDVALVLVTDVSRSIDDSEFELEKSGYAAAFSDPKVLSAIAGGANGRIAVAYVEFAGSYEVRTVLDWAVVSDAASGRSFADAMKAAPRSFYGRTSISAGIDAAMKLLNDGRIEAARRVIDVAGDGTNNAGRDVTASRDDAVAAGVTINGLTIINEHPVSYIYAHVQPPGGLTEWYRQNVTGGPGTFVVEVRSFDAFGEAMTRKLVNEIASLARSHG